MTQTPPASNTLPTQTSSVSSSETTSSNPPDVSMLITVALASLCEQRESDTRHHIVRIKHYLRVLAQALSTQEKFADALEPQTIELLVNASPLYDLGESCVPDRVLLKPGALNADELALMKAHTTKGHASIVHIEQALGAGVSLPALIKEITRSHHERWDGSGYPQGLAGAAIPVTARLVALVDTYDALTSDRVYKSGVPHADAVAIIVKGQGKQFDPDIVDQFVALQAEFAAISVKYADTDDDMQRKMEYIADSIAEAVSF